VLRTRARYGRSADERVPRRQNLKSMTVSVVLLIAVFAFIIGFIIALSVIVGRPKSPRPPTPQAATSSNMVVAPPEVTSSACHVVGDKKMCFRFASNLTRSRCLEVEGVIITINSSSVSSTSSSSLSSPSAAAAAALTICYHNVCLDYIVDNRFCFLNRSHPPFFSVKRKGKGKRRFV